MKLLFLSHKWLSILNAFKPLFFFLSNLCLSVEFNKINRKMNNATCFAVFISQQAHFFENKFPITRSKTSRIQKSKTHRQNISTNQAKKGVQSNVPCVINALH